MRATPASQSSFLFFVFFWSLISSPVSGFLLQHPFSRKHQSCSRCLSSPELGPLPGPAPGPPPEPSPPLPSKGIVTVLGPDGAQLRVIEAKPGSNLRKTLQASKIDVYDLMGKMTNCNGAGQCGTCVVKVTSPSWGLRSEYEADKILKGRKFGESEEYRLACQTTVERGEATVVVRPPKKGK
ncbi:ferredoxin [Nannochloropsis gaditana]|uniref:Ferredoxin n=1 Tax=Nannochloropsis gaditana TaxID=72520 RepID=W7TJ05_9STRA|nr:ferredoxin [Nannochloropsis gaditana]